MATLTLRTFVAYVEDRPGVLNRISSLFRRRGYNIVSLNVGRWSRPLVPPGGFAQWSVWSTGRRCGR